MADGVAQRPHLELLGAASAPLAQPGDLRARLERALRQLVGELCQQGTVDGHESSGQRGLVTTFADPELERLVELLGQRIAAHVGAVGSGTAESTVDAGEARAPDTVHAREDLGPEAMLLGVVSHDLRNPLGVVTMGAALLLAQELTDAQRRLVSKIELAGRKASELISDLLDFTVARAHGIRLSPEAEDLHALVAQAIDDLRTTSPHREIEHARVGDATSRFDQARVEQIVTNLIGNALQHSAPMTPVLVETRGEPTAIVLSVKNHGDPIPDAVKRQLFTPLQRGENAGARRGSVGLGLFIVHQLVLAHGGTVEVSSSEADGTRFTVRLPRVPSPPTSGVRAPRSAGITRG
jgi:sigma-B regulation protein RsbU (phosphoserine phosphatase)